ncbi:MAG: hypothetical protein A2W22_03115 [Candidatus Levybacteria bacterium RBG_16_35_11]|nr:MAG: hypothetical protein A2W22_03115 [Candidatus Levybacteria bacterium RBG_16_35_11]
MNANEINENLVKHALWITSNQTVGVRANLSEANLSGADLSGADLSEADLSEADLSGADLSKADLSEADLSKADLSKADLSKANLSKANLSGASGIFATGYFGKHHAVAAGGYISIGCERHTYDEWLKDGENIGKNNGYTDDEINLYMAWIRLTVSWLKEMEK